MQRFGDIPMQQAVESSLCAAGGTVIACKQMKRTLRKPYRFFRIEKIQ